MNSSEIFRCNSCLFGHFFFYIWFWANINGRPYDSLSKQFLVFYFFNLILTSFIASSWRKLCYRAKKNWDFHISMLIMVWNIQKSAPKNVWCVRVCVCVCSCVFGHVCACLWVFVHACLCAPVPVRMRARTRVCVCVWVLWKISVTALTLANLKGSSWRVLYKEINVQGRLGDWIWAKIHRRVQISYQIFKKEYFRSKFCAEIQVLSEIALYNYR